MFISPFILILLAVIIIILVTVVSYLVSELSRKKKHVSHEHTGNPYQASATIIQHAQEKAEHIIDRAVEQSQQTLFKTEFLKNDLVKHGEQSIQEIINHIIQQLSQDGVAFDAKYKDLFGSLEKQYSNQMQEALALFEKEASAQLSAFRESVKTASLSSQQKLDQQIAQEFSVAKQEIESYKKVKIAKIDASIAGILEQVVQAVLGRAISLSDHKNLILDSLEEAKRDGLFGSLTDNQPEPMSRNQIS